MSELAAKSTMAMNMRPGGLNEALREVDQLNRAYSRLNATIERSGKISSTMNSVMGGGATVFPSGASYMPPGSKNKEFEESLGGLAGGSKNVAGEFETTAGAAANASRAMNEHAEATRNNIKNTKPSEGGGGGKTEFFGGLGTFGKMFALAEAAKFVWDAGTSLQGEVTKMRMQGIDEKSINNMQNQSLAASNKVPGTTEAEAMILSRKLGAIVGNENTTQSLLNSLMTDVKAIGYYTGETIEASTKTLLRGVEARQNLTEGGKISPEQMMKEASAFTRVTIATGGDANARQLMHTLQMSSEWNGLVKQKPDEAYGFLGAAAMSFGEKAGMMIGAAQRELFGGKLAISKDARALAFESGLFDINKQTMLPDPGIGKLGHPVPQMQDAIKIDVSKGLVTGVDDLISHLKQGYQKMHGGKEADPNELQKLIDKMFDKTTARLISWMASEQGHAQIQREITNTGKPGSEEELIKVMNQDPAFALETLIASSKNLATEFMKLAIDLGLLSVIRGLADAIRTATDFLHNNSWSSEITKAGLEIVFAMWGISKILKIAGNIPGIGALGELMGVGGRAAAGGAAAGEAGAAAAAGGALIGFVPFVALLAGATIAVTKAFDALDTRLQDFFKNNDIGKAITKALTPEGAVPQTEFEKQPGEGLRGPWQDPDKKIEDAYRAAHPDHGMGGSPELGGKIRPGETAPAETEASPGYHLTPPPPTAPIIPHRIMRTNQNMSIDDTQYYEGHLPGFATGAWNLPGNMAANLHAGEMVVPANFAAGLRSSVSSGSTPASSPDEMNVSDFNVNTSYANDLFAKSIVMTGGNAAGGVAGKEQSSAGGNSPPTPTSPAMTPPQIPSTPAPVMTPQQMYGGSPAPVMTAQQMYGGSPAPVMTAQQMYGGSPAPVMTPQQMYGGVPDVTPPKTPDVPGVNAPSPVVTAPEGSGGSSAPAAPANAGTPSVAAPEGPSAAPMPAMFPPSRSAMSPGLSLGNINRSRQHMGLPPMGNKYEYLNNPAVASQVNRQFAQEHPGMPLTSQGAIPHSHSGRVFPHVTSNQSNNLGANPSVPKQGFADSHSQSGHVFPPHSGVTGHNLAANQQEAYKAARSSGLSDKASKILVANMSGESLAKPNDSHYDVHHMSQGIVQWDPQRVAAIKAHFGAEPKDMSVGDQTKAALWEMQNNKRFASSWNALNNEGLSDQKRMGMIVHNYEAPRDEAAATATRMGYLGKMPTLDAGYTPPPNIGNTPNIGNIPPNVGYTPPPNVDSLVPRQIDKDIGDVPRQSQSHVHDIKLNLDGELMGRHIIESQFDFSPAAASGTAAFDFRQHAFAPGASLRA
jgi:hypothetical protein